MTELTKRWGTVTHFGKDRKNNDQPYLLGEHRGRTYRMDVTAAEMTNLHRVMVLFRDCDMQLTDEWEEV